MRHAILKHWHPMLGWDFHVPWVPGTPAPAPSPVPYKTCATLAWVAAAAGMTSVTKMASSHSSQGFGFSMLQDTDIGMMIPHVGPPSLLTPLDILFSASKSYFFTSQYKAEGQNVAVALLLIVNPNLNCGTPVPTPTGLVLALNTHFASMTWAEFLAGLNRMAIECIVQAILNFVLGKVGDLIISRLTFILRYYTFRAMPKVLSNAAAKRLLVRQGAFAYAGRGGAGKNAAARALAQESREQMARYNQWLTRTDMSLPVPSGVINSGVGYVSGGPMGFDNGAMGGPTIYGETAEPGVGAVQNYLNSPRAETFPPTPPSTPPSPSTPPPTPTSTPAPPPTTPPSSTPTPAPSSTPNTCEP